MNKIIVLEDPFDPYELPPGYYTAYSDTAAYPTLWSMVNVGIARDEGSSGIRRTMITKRQ